MIHQSLKLFRRALENEPAIKKNLVYVILLEVISVVLLYYLNSCYGSLYDGISTYNTYRIYSSMGLFASLAGVLVFVGGLATYYINRLGFAIREGLNTHYQRRFHDLYKVDNRDQRIQEDLKNFGEYSCNFWFAVFKSILKIPIFVGVVISLTQWWVGLTILLAVFGGTFAVKYAAKSLVKLQAKQESNEASYRKQITSGIFDKFNDIKTLFNEINLRIKKLSYLQSGLGQTFVLLPFVILIPFYLSKAINMGVLMQSANALGRVIDSLTILIEQRQLIVNISTCLLRMEMLEVETGTFDKNGWSKVS